jgi:hypothetical protein
VRNMFLEQIGSRSRTKRQNFDAGALCQTRSYYVDPQAALNVNGKSSFSVLIEQVLNLFLKFQVTGSML